MTFTIPEPWLWAIGTSVLCSISWIAIFVGLLYFAGDSQKEDPPKKTRGGSNGSTP